MKHFRLVVKMILFLLLVNCAFASTQSYDQQNDFISDKKSNRVLTEKVKPPPLQGEHHHKMYKHFNASNPSPHKHAWMALEMVDGLKNEDVVVLVTTTGIKNFHYVRERIMPSSRTWMKMFANVFVIAEDTPQARFALRHCIVDDSRRLTSFECHNEPIYVLSRKCTSQYYGGPGPCCKVDDLFTHIISDRPELFAHTKYVLHSDDDTYFRPDQVLRWLAAIEASGMNTYPIIANNNANDPRENVWHIKGCTEVHTNGWYQPMMLNHAALERMKVATASYGLMDTCNTFKVTHDVGMGPFAWLFGLYHTTMYGVVIMNGGWDHMNPWKMVVHAMKHLGVDSCSNVTVWSGNTKYDQNLVIGCGDVGRPSPGHDPTQKGVLTDMYDGWEFYRTKGEDAAINFQWDKRNVTLHPNGTMLPGISTAGDENKVKVKHVLTVNDTIAADGTFQGLPVVTRYVPVLLQLAGYDTTEHSKKYDILKKWVQFNMTDCKIPGVVGRLRG